MVSMETCTAVLWGPLSFIIGIAMPRDAPWVLPMQILVSLGQIYGDVLYYGTCIN